MKENFELNLPIAGNLLYLGESILSRKDNTTTKINRNYKAVAIAINTKETINQATSLNQVISQNS